MTEEKDSVHSRQVFISYARADDESFAKRLYGDLIGRGVRVWWDREKMESRGRVFLQEIRDAISESDRVLLVVGPAAIESDYVRAEWEHALLFSKAVVPLLRIGESKDIPSEIPKVHRVDFRPNRSYEEALTELLRILATPIPTLSSLVGVPQLPPHFIVRREEIADIGEKVLLDLKKPQVITHEKQSTVITGMGGLGKSVIAAAFARSRDARTTFKDGIIWLSIGQNPDLLSNIKILGSAVGDRDFGNYSDLELAKAHIQRILENKNCLVILDNVWNVEHVQHVRDALGSKCRLLITTRDRSVATSLGAQEHLLGVLNESQALILLAEWCEKEVASLPPEAKEIAKECGYLPFAISLCGAMIRDGSMWSDALDALKEADLTFMEKIFPNYGQYSTILKSMKVSVDALVAEDSSAAECYKELVIFYGKDVPEAAVINYWLYRFPELTERNARSKILPTLASKSLLKLNGKAPNRSISLHDLQHDYLQAITHDMKVLHSMLLEAYARKRPWEDLDWAQVDDYGLQHLSRRAYELRDDEVYKQELYEIVCKALKDEKFRRFGSYHSFIEDVKLVIEAAYSEEPPNILQILRGALIHTTLSIQAIELPSNIFWVLTMLGEEKSALGFAALMDKQSRAKAHCMIGEALLKRQETEDVEKGKSILLDILKSVVDEYNSEKVEWLSKIGAPLIEAGECNEVLSTARTIGDIPNQTQALSNIAKDLISAKKFDRALMVAKEIEDISEQAAVLSDLVQALANICAFEDAMKIVEEDIKECYWKSWALSAIADIHFHRNEKTEAVETAKVAKQKAQVIKDFRQKSKALTRVAEVLSQVGERQEAVQIMQQLMTVIEEETNDEYEISYLKGLLLPVFVQIGEEDTASNIVNILMNEFKTIKDRLDADRFNISTLSVTKEEDLKERLKVIAEALAKAGKFENLEKVAYYIDRSALNQIAFLMAKTGGLDQALIVVNMHAFIEVYSSRSRREMEIVKYLSQEREFEKAIAIIARGIDWTNTDILASTAYSMARLRDSKAAGEMASQIEKLAREMASQIKFTQESHGPAEGWSRLHITALATQAMMLTLVNNNEEAKRVANQVLKLAESRQHLRYEGRREDTLVKIVKALARAKRVHAQLIWSVTNRIQQEEERMVVLIQLAQALTEVGQYSEAIKEALNIIDIATLEGLFHNDRDAFYRAIVVLTLAGDTKRAELLVDHAHKLYASPVYDPIFVNEGESKTSVLAKVVHTLAEMGKVVEATIWAKTLLDITNDVDNTVYAIPLSSNRARLNQMLDTTTNVSDLCRLAQAFAYASDFDQALRITTDRINDEQSKTRTLVSIVDIMARTGALERAYEVTEKQIKDEEAKNDALITICQSLIQVNNKPKAKEIIMQLQDLPYTYGDLLRIRAELGLKDEVKDAVEHMLDAPYGNFQDLADAAGYLAQAMANAGQINEAVKYWTEEFKNKFLDSQLKYQFVDDKGSIGRYYFYQMLLSGVPFISSINQGQETLWKIYQEIVEVESW